MIQGIKMEEEVDTMTSAQPNWSGYKGSSLTVSVRSSLCCNRWKPALELTEAVKSRDNA